MARVEISTAPADLIGGEEHVKAIEEAVKSTEIEPTTEKATNQQTPASSPVEEVLVAEKTVDVSSATVEKPPEKLIVTLPVPKPAAGSAPLESQEAEKHKCETVEVPEEAEPAEEVSVQDEGLEATTKDEEAPVALVTAAEEKAEEEVPAEIPEGKVESA